MGAGSFFRKRNAQVTVPDQSSLRNQITAAIQTYLRVRGLPTLLLRDTLLVVRKNFDIFVMPGSDGLEDPTGVVGLFRLHDAESFEEFRQVHGDPLLRSGALGKMTLGHLADQLANRVLESLHGTSESPATASDAPPQSDSGLLPIPVMAETK